MLPDIKLNINNVYSRLYNNAVLLTPVYKNNFLNKARPKTKDKLATSLKIEPNPKIKFNIKNALDFTNGKEFTVKVTDSIINRCYTKYSGGPENISYLRDKLKDNKNDKQNIQDFVDFYSLTNKNDGNSFLHLAVIGDYPEIVRYFIEKGADINKKNNEGDTALHLALKEKKIDIVKILMEGKPALNIPNNDGIIQFELFSSQMKKDFGIDKLLIDNPVKKDR